MQLYYAVITDFTDPINQPISHSELFPSDQGLDPSYEQNLWLQVGHDKVLGKLPWRCGHLLSLLSKHQHSGREVPRSQGQFKRHNLHWTIPRTVSRHNLRWTTIHIYHSSPHTIIVLHHISLSFFTIYHYRSSPHIISKHSITKPEPKTN